MIVCALCGSQTSVRETRSHGNYIRRRRYCDNTACNGRMVTVEIATPTFFGDEPIVVITKAELEAVTNVIAGWSVRAKR